MEIRQLHSSAITKAGYDEPSRTLKIWFTSDPHQGYDYTGVPAQVWHGLLAAPSAGMYFHSDIEKQYGR